jgi:hypothetical protein
MLSVSARLPALALALLMVMVLPGRVHAQAVNHLYDKLQFGLSGATVILGSDIRIDNADGTVGTDIDQGALGLPKSTFAWAAGAAWRPGRRHQLQLGYVSITRSGNKVLTDTVDFADTSFAAGLKIESKFSAPALTLAYNFAFLAKEKTQVGFQVALGALFFDLGIDAVAGATAGGADTTIVRYSASKSLLGPTAALGLFAAFRAGDHWYFDVNGGAIGATVSNISATTWVLGADARYYFSNRWAAIGAYSASGIKISSEGDGNGWIDLSGSIKYNFQTIRLGVIYALH